MNIRIILLQVLFNCFKFCSKVVRVFFMFSSCLQGLPLCLPLHKAKSCDMTFVPRLAHKKLATMPAGLSRFVFTWKLDNRYQSFITVWKCWSILTALALFGQDSRRILCSCKSVNHCALHAGETVQCLWKLNSNVLDSGSVLERGPLFSWHKTTTELSTHVGGTKWKHMQMLQELNTPPQITFWSLWKRVICNPISPMGLVMERSYA